MKRPENIAKRVAKTFGKVCRLEEGLDHLKVRATVESLGASHVIMQQYFERLPIHRAYLTIHIGRKDSCAYLIKNRTVPVDFLENVPQFKTSRNRALEKKAEQRAVKWLTYKDKLKIFTSKTKKRWLPVKDKIRPCYRVRIQRVDPREDWLIFVDALNWRVLKSCNNLNLARANGKAPRRKRPNRGYVFDPSPAVALNGHQRLLNKKQSIVTTIPEEAYTKVRLDDLDPDSMFLDGKRVTTSMTKRRVKRPENGLFEFGSEHRGFGEVMAYYHLNKAIKYLESLGYRGNKKIFDAPIPVNTRATKADQSWYDAAVKCLGFGGGEVEDVEDAEVIIHELGHAVQDAIIPDYGQSPQAQAMGEGFGDYLAASLFDDKKKGDYKAAVMTWDGIHETCHHGKPRSLRRVDNEELTFLNYREADGCHENGLIWSATLWDIFKAVGKDVADHLIIESHYEQNGFTKFSRGARAILHADQNLYNGKHEKKLKAIFKQRLIKLS